MIHLWEVVKSPVKEVAVNSYLFETEEGFIVFDPVNFKQIKEKVGNEPVCAVFLTHAHWDHYLALEEILKEFNCKCYMHSCGFENFSNSALNASSTHNLNITNNFSKENFVFIEQTSLLYVCGLRVKVHSTPGHSSCSLSYIVNDKYLICGDSLRLGKSVRLDLPTSSEKDYEITKKLLWSLDENLTVLSGHEGVETLKFFKVSKN